ncbi:MAG: AAA family ATPase [Peptococcaceae bacterium]|nr:AAA family ATPase [Peptococcaceae bacterium]
MRVIICDADVDFLQRVAQNVKAEVITVSSAVDCLQAEQADIAFIGEVTDVMPENLITALAQQGTAVYLMSDETNLDLLMSVLNAGGKGICQKSEAEVARIVSIANGGQADRHRHARPLRGRLDRGSTVKTTPTPAQDLVSRPSARPSHHKDNKVIIHNNKLVVCYAFKGGVGKTMVSASLAVALANNPQTKLSVVVVDFDPFNGDLAKVFNIQPRCSILDWLSKDTEDLKDYLVDHPSGVKILPGPRNPLDGIAIGRQEAARILSILTRRFDVVIVDTTHMPRESVTLALENASKVFIIANPSRVTLQDNGKMAETLAQAQIDISNFQLVLNMMPKKPPLRFSDYAEVLPWKNPSIIPHDPAVDRIINSGGLPVLDRRSKAFNQAVRQLANQIIPVFGTTKSGFRFPLFMRRRAAR